VIDMSEGLGLDLAPTSAHHDPHHQDHGLSRGRDPHLWLSPPLVEATARRLAAALAELDPTHARDYETRLERFLEQLREVDGRVMERLSKVEPRKFLVLHPAWGWYADHYRLDQIAVEHEGKEPGPRQRISVIEEARRNRLRVIFVQRGFPKRSAQWIADEIGGEVVEIDPLAPDWFANLERVADAIGRSSE
jgi:zinc transport system substrate-binding protein